MVTMVYMVTMALRGLKKNSAPHITSTVWEMIIGLVLFTFNSLSAKVALWHIVSCKVFGTEGFIGTWMFSMKCIS